MRVSGFGETCPVLILVSAPNRRPRKAELLRLKMARSVRWNAAVTPLWLQLDRAGEKQEGMKGEQDRRLQRDSRKQIIISFSSTC